MLALIIAPLPARPQAQSVYASGSLSSGNPFVAMDIGGQSTCRLDMSVSSGTLPGSAAFTVSLISVGSTTTYPTLIFDNHGNPMNFIAGTAVPGAFEIYAQSAGTVEISATGMSTAIVTTSINCSGGGPAYQTVTFPSAQPVTCASGCSGGAGSTPIPYTSASPMPVVFPTPFALSYTTASPLPVTTGAPVTQVTAVPSCPASGYPCGLPTPIPTLAPQPAPTATTGVTPQPLEPWMWTFKACQYTGSDTNSARASPNPNIGNLIGCQSNFDGSELVSLPQINSQVSVTANGTYLNTMVDGVATCNLKMNPGSGSSATVSVKNSSSIVFAGPYSVSGSTNTATFQLVTDAYAVLDSLFIAVTSFSGTNPIVITLTCSSAPGVVHAYQASAPWKMLDTDASGNGWTPSSPQPVHDFIPVQPSPLYTMPVTTPAPMPTAPSPAPVGVYPIGYNASGAAAPVFCTKQFQGTITTTVAQLVAAVAGKAIYVCSYVVTIYGTVAGTARLEQGTTCAGATALSNFDFPASGAVTVVAAGNGIGQVLGTIPAGDAFCVIGIGTIGGGHVSGTYEQF